MWQNLLLCVRGGNWDTKPARRKHPNFHFVSSLFSQTNSGSCFTSWLPASHPPLAFSSFPVSCVASCFAHPLSTCGLIMSGCGHRRGERQEDAYRKYDSLCPPTPSSPFCLFFSYFTCIDIRLKKKKKGKQLPLFISHCNFLVDLK